MGGNKMEKMLSDNIYENAKLWLEKLEKNEKEVGVERLQSAYGRGYAKMLEYTRSAVMRAEIEYLLTAVPKGCQKNVRRVIVQTIQFPWEAVRNTYDLDLGLELLVREWYKLQMKYYVPYWIGGIRGARGEYFSAYLNMWWNEERQCWESEDKKSFSISLPPTRDSCLRKLQQIMMEIPEDPDEIQRQYANRLRKMALA